MNNRRSKQPKGRGVKSLLLLLTLWGLPSCTWAQSGQHISLLLNHDRIVAGQPLLLKFQVDGVPDKTNIVFKNQDKGWISARLLDAEGKEVGAFGKGIEETVSETVASPSDLDETADEPEGTADGNGVIYTVPTMTSNRRIVIPQTEALTKTGTYRLVVRVRLLAALQPHQPAPKSRDELNAQEPKTFRVLKAKKIFRVVVTDVGPEALAKKARELRDTIVLGAGPEVLEAAQELKDWLSPTALQEWGTLAKDPRCPERTLQMFLGMLASDGTSSGVKFFGELTWGTHTMNMRAALAQISGLNPAPSIKKQIDALFAAHGEDVPKIPMVFD